MAASKIQPGMHFGRLTAKEELPHRPNEKRKWLCACICGRETEAEETALLRGKRVSCGCAKKDSRPYRVKHGMCGTRLYRIWANMLSRCYAKSSSNYKWYGARGIEVCDAWRSFVPFRDWALENGYSESLELDRSDNDGNYEPSNCRWITHKEQCNNRRKPTKGD